ncbi:phosphatase PAP2 family protein [Paenibacillus methanolicus]|uniref:Undecaprenyl-diphosphatase n=1 Tax=Paenibacillus methanolicus TaxID=582686 RepID=A0A5S5BS90_9BACL|nr:phosphatase PAP2 family protein [Paenibacillus methanolicus]TYP69156.1 undecaprenyl-diphosphatase [Paenibacillus methanolicus]
MDWDYRLFKWINDGANNESVIGKVLVYAADLGDYFFFFSLVFMFLVHRKMAFYGVIAVGVTVLCSRGIAHFYYRDRPFVTHDVNLLLPHIESNSFPSDHASAAFAIAMMFCLFSRKIGLPYLGFAAIVSFSRIWTGKHYPTDVLAGMFLGIVLSIALYLLLNRYAVYNSSVHLLKRFTKKG